MQLLDFLNEINGHGWIPIENQKTYNCYEKKKDFMKKLEEMEEMKLIQLQKENGTIKSIKLDLSGDILRYHLNIIIKGHL